MNEQLILGRYRLVERLAVGGTAEVWRAHDQQLDRAVAVKRLHPHLLPDRASRERLRAEARAAASLSHPVIVDVYDVDADGEAPALIMELVEGESLAARIERGGPLPADEAAAITADVAEALFHAHQQGVIHRDVKPGNVLLGRDGRTRLVDFGIAHSLAESVERLTLTGTVIGTLRAMSPEQLAGRPVTPRTDVYGLGVVLHEALTGRSPYPSSSPIELAEAQRAGPPPLGGLDPALAAVIAGCLSFDPAQRPLHAGALAAALRGWAGGDPSAALALAPAAPPAVDSSAVTQAIPTVAAVDVAPVTPVPTAAGGRSRARPLALLVGLAALTLGAAVVAGLARDDGAIGVEPTPIPTTTPTPAPTPTQAPEWLAKLAEEIAKDCGQDAADAAQIEMAVMTEDQAKEYAEAVREQCKEAAGGNGGDGGGGGGNGRGGGGGGDD